MVIAINILTSNPNIAFSLGILAILFRKGYIAISTIIQVWNSDVLKNPTIPDVCLTSCKIRDALNLKEKGKYGD